MCFKAVVIVKVVCVWDGLKVMDIWTKAKASQRSSQGHVVVRWGLFQSETEIKAM